MEDKRAGETLRAPSKSSRELRTFTLEAWVAEGERRFGPERRNWRFVCPSCGFECTAEEWISAGAPQNSIAFSCVGRWDPGLDRAADALTGRRPCNYAGGGLFKLNPTTILDLEGGAPCTLFAFAAPLESLEPKEGRE
jgi:hypothetical protein